MKRISVRDARGSEKEVYVGRRTPYRKGHILSNPFRLTSYDTVGHLEAVEKYRHWLWARIKDHNTPILTALAQLQPDSTLVCYCRSNQACHADVIMRAWHYCWEQGIIPPPVTPWTAPDPTRPRQATSLFLLSDKQSYTRKTEKVA